MTESSPRGELLIAACRSGRRMARRIVAQYRRLDAGNGASQSELFLEDVDTQFSDTETVVQLAEDVSGRDAFIIQALHDPTSERSKDDNYAALLITVRASREWRANHMTVILPYLPFLRVIDIAGHLAELIYRIHNNQAVEQVFCAAAGRMSGDERE